MQRECAAGDAVAAKKRLDAVAEMPLPLISEDALHIAIATIYGIVYLLTRNRRHIANPEIERNISLYLEQVELFLPFICTPEELLGDGNE